jgi:predicted RNA-binding protein with PIN domain
MTVPDLIIDGYNLLKSLPDFFKKYDNLHAQREHLIRILKSNPKLRNRQVLLVFDGGGENTQLMKSAHEKINIIFSNQHRTADDIIQKKIRQAKHPENIQVVSSDREIQHTAQSHGAKIIDSTTFWKNYNKKSTLNVQPRNSVKNSDRELSDKEVRKWLDIFQQKESDEDEI